MKLKPLAEQVVVVFGASSGIGRATAKQFAQNGAAVVVAARTRSSLDQLVQEIEQKGGRAFAVVADAAESTQVMAVADAVIEAFGRLDTWVHAASTAVWATFEETSQEEWERIIQVNLNGTIYAAKAALPLLRQQGRGAFIAISSVEAEIGLPYQSAYAASKHAVRGFLDVLRLELKHEGLQTSITNVMPSTINTPFFNNARTKLGVKPVGIPPIYQPQLVANAIVYAAEHPVPEIVVGGGGKLFSLLKRFAPSFVDQFLLALGFGGQHTHEPKPETAPTNLYAPETGERRVEGDYSDMARGTSTYTWLATHPAVRRAVIGVVLGAAAVCIAHRPRRK